MPRLGQHFLKNKSVVKKIADALELRDGDLVIEIGPGHGELTAAIAAKADVKIIAIEKDARLAQLLRDAFLKKSEMEIVEGDALKVLPDLTQEKIPTTKPWKLAGNIPYYITGKLLRTVSELDHKPERSVIMVQREVAVRICATPPHMNRLAASVQFWADVKIVMHVPKEDFSPVPDVDSAVIVLTAKTPQANIGSDRYYGAVHAVFSQPRKTILNNVAAGAKNGLPKQEIEGSIKKLGLDPGARPQNLTTKDIESIAEAFF